MLLPRHFNHLVTKNRFQNCCEFLQLLPSNYIHKQVSQSQKLFHHSISCMGYVNKHLPYHTTWDYFYIFALSTCIYTNWINYCLWHSFIRPIRYEQISLLSASHLSKATISCRKIDLAPKLDIASVLYHVLLYRDLNSYVVSIQ